MGWLFQQFVTRRWKYFFENIFEETKFDIFEQKPSEAMIQMTWEMKSAWRKNFDSKLYGSWDMSQNANLMITAPPIGTVPNISGPESWGKFRTMSWSFMFLGIMAFVAFMGQKPQQQQPTTINNTRNKNRNRRNNWVPAASA